MRLLVVVALLVGCVDSPSSNGPSVTSGVIRQEIPIAVNRKVDVLLVVDSTPAMAAHGERLRANLRALAERLRDNDLHIAFVTADPADEARPRTPDGVTGGFIADVYGTTPGARIRNYVGDLADLVVAGGDVGTAGATSSPLAVAKRFLEDELQSPGFLRKDALAAIFVITASELPDEPVAAYADAFEALHAEPSMIVVAGVSGASTRLAAFLALFPNRHAHAEITADVWTPVIDLVRATEKQTLGATCVEGPLFDGDPRTPGTQHVCNVWFDYPGGSELVPACPATPDRECWRLAPDPLICDGNDRFELVYRRPEIPANTVLVLECLTQR